MVGQSEENWRVVGLSNSADIDEDISLRSTGKALNIGNICVYLIFSICVTAVYYILVLFGGKSTGSWNNRYCRYSAVLFIIKY